MSESTVPYKPEGFQSLTPHLICRDAAGAIEFYKRAFGAIEKDRLATADGKLMHASVYIGDAVLMLVDEMPQYGVLSPQSLNGSPVTIHLWVPDVDAVYAQAVAAGATAAMPVADMFWGDRYGTLLDPFGHRWSVATHQREVSMAEAAKAMASMGM